MTRFLLAFLLSLPLACMVGCTPLAGDPPGDDDDGGVNDDDDNDASDDDDGADDDDDEYLAILHMVAPYGWVGDFSVDGDIVHEDDTECWVEFDEPATQVEVTMQEDDLWVCMWRFVNIPESADDTSIDLVDPWLEEGQCGLAPDDEYGTYNVYTEIEDGKVMINGLAPFPVPVTGNTFFGEGTSSDGEHVNTLEGIIADDLSWIEFTLTWWHTGDQEWRVDEMTISR